MKLRQIVEEITDDLKKEYSKGFKYEAEDSGEGFHLYSFTIGDAKYEAQVSGVDCPGGRNCNMYSVSFEDVDEGQGLTGKGNVREVFSTVIEIVKDFLTREPGKNLFFSSGDGDRVRDMLYRRFTQSVGKVFPGYVGITSETEGGNLFVVPEKNAEKFIKYYKSKSSFEKNFTIHK